MTNYDELVLRAREVDFTGDYVVTRAQLIDAIVHLRAQVATRNVAMNTFAKKCESLQADLAAAQKELGECSGRYQTPEQELVAAARARIKELESKLTKQLLSEGRMLCRAQDAELALATARARVAELETELDNIKTVEFPKRLNKVNNIWRQRAERAEADLAAARALLRKMRKEDYQEMRLWQWHEAIDIALPAKEAT